MSNPYAPPSAEPGASSPAPLADEPPPDGKYELEPADGSAVVRARMGAGWLWLVLLGVNVAMNAMSGNFQISWSIVFVAIMAAISQLAPVFAGRAVTKLQPGQRRIRIAFAHDKISIADDAGSDSRIAWSLFKGRRLYRDWLLLEQTSGVTHILPRRAWGSDGEFQRVQSYVGARVAELKRSFAARYAVIIWFVLILLFVAIWSFFSDVPPRR